MEHSAAAAARLAYILELHLPIEPSTRTGIMLWPPVISLDFLFLCKNFDLKKFHVFSKWPRIWWLFGLLFSEGYFVCLSEWLSVCLTVCLSVCLTFCLWVILSVTILSVYLCVCFNRCLCHLFYTCLFAYAVLYGLWILSVCQSICQCLVCVNVTCMYVCVFVFLPLSVCFCQHLFLRLHLYINSDRNLLILLFSGFPPPTNNRMNPIVGHLMMVDGASRFHYVLAVLVAKCRYKCRVCAVRLSCVCLERSRKVPSCLGFMQKSDLMMCHLAGVLDNILQSNSVSKA